MEARDDIYEVWLQYIQTNDEGHFREFTRGFVATWENQLGLDWVQFPTVEESKSDLGPHLSRLPEELLPAIGRFLINSDHSSKKLIKCENIRQTHELVRCLIILSRNFDNIPFIASCDFVGLLVGFAAAIIHQLVEGEVAEFQFAEEAKGFVTRVCRLLECLYDPYFSWRAFLQEKPWTKTQLPFQPALLHVEVIPFLYDCFETCISTVAPELSSELIHVLGAVVSGAQNVAVWLAPSEQPEKLETAPKEEGHNGLRAICPATVNVVLDSVVAAQSSPGLRCVSLRCFVAMVHTLQRSAPDQRQIEVGTMFQQFREAMHDLADFVWAPPRSEPSTPDVAKQVSLDPVSPDTSQHLPCSEGLVCELVLTLQRVLSLDPASNSAIADVLVENRIQDSLLDLLYRVESRSVYEKQAISVECVKALTGMLGASARGRAKLQQDGSYSRLFSAIQTQGCPSRELLQALLEMSSTPTGDELTDVEPLLLLMRWLPEISRTDQFWLAVAVHQLCTASVQSKCLACENQLLNAVSQTLGQHSELDREAAFELIRIVESLASLSISAVELKQLFMLLRDDTGADRFPYHVQLLHAVSSVARREDLVECHSYFDIQNDSDGIVVPGIKRWPGTGYGISFHVWLRLNEEEPSEPSASSNRRQLFNMSTGTGSGVEMFLLTNGALAVAILSKKEFLVATVPDQRIQDGHWHCVTVCHMAARRPFGQNQLAVYIDGHQRLTAALKFPPTMDPFTSCYIGCPCLSSKNAMDDEKSGKSGGSLMLGAVGSFLPSIVSHVPNYFTLPLRSSSSHSNPHDPNVKSYPLGMQDNIYGPQTRLGGQLALAALFHEALSYQQVRTLYEAGPSCRPLFSVEEGMEQADITTRLVLCYSAAATHQGRVLDLSPGAKYEARCSAPVRRTLSIKVSINGLGGVHVLLPILQMACSPSTTDVASYSPDLAPPPLLQRRNSTPGLGRRVSESIVSPEELDDWEVLPSSSYSDWKLEQNPVSGFLSLLRNVLTRSPGNQDNLLKNNGVGIVGDMLTKVRPRLIDVHVLMAVQLLVEMARDTPNQLLLRALHHHILFNFHIWARSQFHIRIGHIQYICTVVKEDRRSYRRRYGVQFVLDTVRQFHGSSLSAATASEGPDVCLEGAPTPDDARTLRGALLGLVKYYLQKEVNVREVNALLGFLSSVKEEILVIEVLEMLTSHIESASCRDQLLLLLYEPQAAETLYCLLLDRNFSHTLKHKVLKLFSVLLRSERVYERHKTRLRLQDATLPNVGLYPGVLSLLDASDFTMELAMMLLDQILLTDVSSSYAGALALLHALSSAPLEVKLEAARKILTTTFMRNTAAQQFAKQVGWQECITRLLVKRPILDGGHSKEDKLPRPGNEGPLQNLPDLMSFDEENLELIASERERPASPSNVSRISSTVSDAASALETEIKEVAETVAGNIHFAADNISSVVASAYSAFRQKTYEMQDSLEEFGATARSRLKRHSLTSLQDALAESGNSPGPNFLLPTHDLDSLSLSNRSSCSSSNEDLTSRPESSASIAPDRIVENSQDDSTDHISSEEQLINQAMEQWKALDAGRLGDREEELCYLVVNILFTVMWRGIEGASKEAWKERGQVLACINLLGLNNELYCSHLELKRRLLEMAMQASVSDLRDESAAGTLASNSENGAQLLRWTYDLVVLDMHGDPAKKCSCKLLDGVLGLIDALLVFQDAPAEEWTEMAKLAFGILLSCAGFADVELVAMATAKLHDLVQTRHMSDPEETAYLLCYLDSIVQKSLQGAQPEHYSFVLPVVKALLAKTPMLQTRLPGLPDTQSGPAFFESFQAYAQTPEWRVLLDDKLKPLYKSYQAALLGEFSDGMNIFWAECYEASKIALQRRARELADSRLRFQSLVMAAFKTRQVEDTARVAGLQVQRRSELLQVRRSWRQTRRFLTGTRGAWRAREQLAEHWKLSHRENVSRMRLKLVPNLTFDPHTEASNLRDNTGWLSRSGADATELSPLSHLSAAALPASDEDEDALPEDEWRRITAEAEMDSAESGGKEKLLLTQECELVTLMSRVKGRLDVTNTHIAFYDLSPLREDADRQDFKWPLSRLRELHLRRYNLRRSALEFFLCDYTNYFVNFSTKTRNKVFTRILSLRPPNLVLSNTRSPAELLRVSGLTQKWVGREISNFDYLMQLNTIAGRTYNDLSQYPVFPWILADYTSPTLNLEDPATFRDLSRPVGVVNPKNETEVRAKYDSFEDPSGTIAKFHYGTHYSNSAGVLHYLVRVEPFTSLHIELQSGRFDVADRQFHSIPQTWKLLMDNPNDVKELTPEFFYFPEFLVNHNKFDLGLLQGTKDRVTDVVLPAWADSPEDFIQKHRQALESEHVSAHLHEWIDLIFGWRQRGPPAVEALNVFYYCSYEGAVDLDAIIDPVEREAVEGMINNFGQTPSQLLREPHPQRLSANEALFRQLRGELRKPDLTLHLDKLRSCAVEVSTDRDPLVFVSCPRSPPRPAQRLFLPAGTPDSLISVSRSGALGLHAWIPHDRSAIRGFSLDTDGSINNAKTRRKVPGPFHPSVTLSSQLFAVSYDARHLFSGGHWDNGLRVFSLTRGRTLAAAIHHADVVTCVGIDRCGWYLITGSRDTTCVIWDVSALSGFSAVTPVAQMAASVGASAANSASGAPPGGGGSFLIVPVHTLYGHDKPVTCVSLSTELDLAVSGSTDGTVNVHTVQEGRYIRTLRPQDEGLQLEVTFLALSEQGHIAFATNTKQERHAVHVFSVNGRALGSKPFPGRVTGLAVAGDLLVASDDAGVLTLATMLGLRPVYDLPLHVPVQSVVVTQGSSHLLVPLRDGRLMVLGLPGPSAFF